MPETDPLATTEDRVDLEDFGEDEPHSLPVLRPARFEEIHRQERPFRKALVAAWRALRGRTFRVLGIRYTGSRKSVRSPLRARKQVDFGAISQIEWQRAIDEYLADVQGDRSIASAEQNWLRSDAVLPEQWRLAITTGIDRATVLTGAAEAALPATNAAALAEFTESAFERLSEGGQSRLQRVLTDPSYPGGSVEQIIRDDIAESVNPLETARKLSKRFDQYEDYEFARLARTETAFAQNFGITAELEAEGFTPTAVMLGADHGFPPFHPNCVCSVTIDTATGRIKYDVSATACEICQSALVAEAIEVGDDPAPAQVTLPAIPPTPPSPTPGDLPTDEWIESLSEEEEDAILLFTDSDWEEMRQASRGESVIERFQEQLRKMEDALDRAAPVDDTIHRGLYDLSDETMDAFREMEGQEITFDAISSSSLDPGVAQEFSLAGDPELGRVEIHIESMTGVDISAISNVPRQEEVIIRRGTRIEVTEVVDNGDSLEILAEEVAP